MGEVAAEAVFGPPPVAPGRNGRWVKLGEVGVESATMAITDPTFANPPLRHEALRSAEHTGAKFGSGVQFWRGSVMADT